MRHMRALLTAVLAVVLARPAMAAPDCAVPERLAPFTVSLPQARQAARAGSLTILVLGGAATAGHVAGDPSATFPARLGDALAAGLPGVRVKIVNAAVARNTAEQTVRLLPGLLHESGAQLVLWATGAREAAIGIGVDAFVDQLDAGISAILAAKADLILIDMQYAPSIARILDLAPYRSALAAAAQARNVPMLDRYELMHAWSEDGVLDLDVTGTEQRQATARKLFGCIAAVLAGPIVEAVR